MLMSVIQNLGSLPGYNINFDKARAMPVGFDSKTSYSSISPFSWSDLGFLYLGIDIKPNVRYLLRHNLTTVQKEINKDLARWMNPPISWMGRISLIKMKRLYYYLKGDVSPFAKLGYNPFDLVGAMQK